VAHVSPKEPWVHLNLPVINEVEQKIPIGPDLCHVRKVNELLHAGRYDLDTLERLKATVGSFVFSSHYQQQPIPEEGEIIKWEWFKRYSQIPPRELNDIIVQSWDTASKATELSDYSVCTTWLVKGKDFYLSHVLREKLGYPDLRRRAIGHALELGADTILIEDNGSGTALIQDLKRDETQGVPYPIEVRPDKDKITRMSSTSPKIEAGHVYLPTSAPWLGDFHDELMQFPNGSHDDQIDSLSQFLGWIDQRAANDWTVEPLEL
jgi:predicted phage terminase large subunit-like protein